MLAGVGLPALAVALVRPARSDTDSLDVALLGRRVLIVAPHPDDEVLATGGTINRLISSGVAVRVVLITAGDGYLRAARRLNGGRLDHAAFQRLGQLRFEESLAAATKLGLSADDLVCLGYPDGMVATFWDQRWDARPEEPALTTGVSRVPYAWAYRPGAEYSGRELAADLTRIVADFSPDTVIAPDSHDTHDDHRASAHFVSHALRQAGFEGRRLSGIVHFGRYPLTAPSLRGRPMDPPPALRTAETVWHSVHLDRAATLAKAAGIASHVSQTRLRDMRMFMSLFVRTNELFVSREPARIAWVDDDTDPPGGTTGTVITSCSQGRPFRLAGPAPLRSLRLVQGPRRLWVGLRSTAPLSPRDEYRIGLRLLGGDQEPRRLDLVMTGDASVRDLCSSDGFLDPGEVTVLTGDRTAWIGLPASILEGYEHCMVGAGVGQDRRARIRTAWRDVALRLTTPVKPLAEPSGDVGLGALVAGVGEHGAGVSHLDKPGGTVHRLPQHEGGSV